MYSVVMDVKIRVPLRIAMSYAERLGEDLAMNFNLSNTEPLVAGTDALPSRPMEVKLWFRARPGMVYEPPEAARAAERMAVCARVLARGRAESVTIGYWDGERFSEIDSYKF